MKLLQYIFCLYLMSGMTSCRDSELDDDSSGDSEYADIDFGDTEIDTPDWTESTHSKNGSADYSVVFPNDEVLRIDISIDAANWTLMQDDLDDNITISRGPGGGGADIDFTPIWVPCQLEFEGKEWYKVGIRYKGNSTLLNAYQTNTDKYPFKLDFDEFEDIYPAIDNQRFYGFKQLNLSNNYNDNSFMREKVAADIFRSFGVPAARTAFCAVYLDRGNGSEYLGLYALVEEVDDTVPDSQFSDGDGNLYKPDGTAASFAFGTYNDEEMDKKSNEDEADFSDVSGLYDILHSDTRTTSEDQWKEDLEGIFDVDQYLKYLAANNVIQNWDTYGNMTHNYFLYNKGGRLTWIPWDHNESMQDGKMSGALSLSMNEVSSSWPIIRYIIDVEEYKSMYDSYLQEFVEGAFEPIAIQSLYSTYESMISDYATQEASSFSNSVSTLKSHVEERSAEVYDYLD
ncbi:MAG: CotH kinase family protein [Reichenbachiella sp.]|uniref:CotH kinase family protein n=1 Tax=Reichenbachiella sp. TaxID=2184521 RepID=UPI003267E15A